MRDTLEEDKSALTKAKDDMAMYYNWWWTLAPVYKPGDRVYLNASDIHTTWPLKKLSHPRLGPFPGERHVGMNIHHLTLPLLMKHLHPVFNVIKLTLAPLDLIPSSILSQVGRLQCRREHLGILRKCRKHSGKGHRLPCPKPSHPMLHPNYGLWLNPFLTHLLHDTSIGLMLFWKGGRL
jgi:hypothetical protein